MNKKIKLNGTYNIPLVDYNEIFPLKKYDFYGYKIYGPKKYTTMDNFYSKKYPMLEYAKIKNSRSINSKYKSYFKLDKYECPEYNRNIIKKDFICNKNTKACIHNNSNKFKLNITPPEINSCCRHYLNDILLFTCELLEKHNITYFIYWGTLLGIIRHSGSIPWDFDNDIYILDSDENKLKQLFSEINKKYFINSFKTKKIRKLYRVNYSKKNRLHVDIYVADQI
jgi:hypothetical protein